jgi:hypothetical protein
MYTAEQNVLNLRFIYYACHAENSLPIGASNTWKGLLEIVDDYMGANEKYNHSGKRIKYVPFESKYPSEFDGTIYYETPEPQSVKVYTVDFNYKKNK